MGKSIILYQNPRRGGSSDSSCSVNLELVPAGVSYLIRHKDGLAWVRSKSDKLLEVVPDVSKPSLKSRSRRKRGRSTRAKPGKIPLIIGGDSYVPGVQAQKTDPLPQQTFFASPSLSASFPQTGSPPIPFPLFGSPPMSQYMYPQFHQPCAHHCPPSPSVPHYQKQMQLPQQMLPQQQMHPAYKVYDPVQDAASNANKHATAPNANATHEELNNLTRVDAHFRKVSMDVAKEIPRDADKKDTYKQDADKKVTEKKGADKEETKPATIMHRHVCANCGKLRSRLYHHKNPIKLGETPEYSYCGKCQEDETSCDEKETQKKPKEQKTKNEYTRKEESEEDKSKDEKSKEKTNDERIKRANKQPTVESSSESERGKTRKSRADSVIKETPRVRTSKDEYIIVEEEVSEDDRSCRGRSHKRDRGQHQRPIGARHEDLPRSSYQNPSNRARSLSQSRYDRYEPPQTQPPPRRRHRRHDSKDSRRSTVSYRHVTAPKHREPEKARESFTQKIPVHFVEREYSPASVSRSPSPMKHHNAPSQPSRHEHRNASAVYSDDKYYEPRKVSVQYNDQYYEPRKVSIHYDEQNYSPNSASRSPSPKKRYAAPSQHSYHEPRKVSAHYDERNDYSNSPSRSPIPAKYYAGPSQHSYENPKQVPLNFSEQEYSQVYEPRSRSPKKQYTAPPFEQFYEDTPRYQPSEVSTQAEWLEDEDIPDTLPTWKGSQSARKSPANQENSFDESVYSQGATSQYRPARRTSPQSTANQWDDPQFPQPGPNVERIVVTEQIVYQKKTEDERRVQEALDRDMLNFASRKPSQPQNTKKYYTDDWSAEGKLDKRRDGAAQVNYEYDDDWRELPPKTEHVPGEWPEGEINRTTWRHTVPEVPGYVGAKKMETGGWRRTNWQDSELFKEDNWSDTEEWKALVAEQRIVVHPKSGSFKLPRQTESYSRSAASLDPKRSRYANEYKTSPSITSEERPHRTSRSHNQTVVSPHVSFGQDRVQYFDDGTPDRSRESHAYGQRERERARDEYEVRSEISGMTEAERELLTRGVRRERVGRSGRR